jgi:hypothetical protein
MKRLIAFPLALVTVVALGAPATAHKQVVTDPDDTGGKLDIRRMVLNHEGGAGGAEAAPTGVGNLTLIFRLRTFDEWHKRRLDEGRGNINFLVKRSPESSWRIRIKRRDDGDLGARLTMCIEAQGCGFGDVENYPVTRPTNKSVRVEVPKSDLGGVGQTVRWMANTASGRGCDGHCHFDRAPDSGLAVHNL